MNVFPRELPLCALMACAAFTTACGSPGYNDNPSQQITSAKVGCLAATDFFAVYFSVHVQPSIESPDARMTKELFRPYCNEIPAPGKVFFTADLVGDELKRTPVGIRLVEQEPGDAENDKNPPAVADVPARTYPKGVIEFDFEIDKAGHYAIYLIRGGDGFSDADRLRIPLNVGVDADAMPLTARILTLFGAASALALIGFAAFRYLRRRKAYY